MFLRLCATKCKKKILEFVYNKKASQSSVKKKGKLSIGKYPIGLDILQLHPKSYFGTTQLLLIAKKSLNFH